MGKEKRGQGQMSVLSTREPVVGVNLNCDKKSDSHLGVTPRLITMTGY